MSSRDNQVQLLEDRHNGRLCLVNSEVAFCTRSYLCLVNSEVALCTRSYLCLVNSEVALCTRSYLRFKRTVYE